MDDLVNEYKGFINLLAKKYGQNEFDDDLKQEGYLALILAKQRYKEEMGNFENYAKVYIKGTMLMFLSFKTRTVKRILRSNDISISFSIDNPFDEFGNTLADIIEDVTEDDSMEDIQFKKMENINYHLKNMDKQNQKILELRINQEKSFVEISKATSIPYIGTIRKFNKTISKLQSLCETPVIDYLRIDKNEKRLKLLNKKGS